MNTFELYQSNLLATQSPVFRTGLFENMEEAAQQQIKKECFTYYMALRKFKNCPSWKQLKS